MSFSRADFSGYPFDRDSDRDGYMRSQLDDIAKRHPEFAEHLESFTNRDRHRPRSSNEEAGSPRRFPRPFGDRFEAFGFPFDREDNFDPEYYTQQFHHPSQEYKQPQQQNSSTYQQSSPEHTSNQSAYSQSPTYQSYPQTSEPDRNNLQQSNTFDLGKGQEPVNDRGQRSMSAPPSENTPTNQSQQTENMSSNSETKSSNERIIPIHIEGRDEPVLPKNIPPSYSTQHSTHQPDRLFGKPTEHFTQFLPHDRDTRFSNNWNQGFVPDEPIRQQRFQPQYSSQKKNQGFVPSQPKGEIPIPVQREVPSKHQEHHQQSQQQHPQNQQHQQHSTEQQRGASPHPSEQPKAPPKPSTPIEQIQAIQKDVASLMEQVEAFTGKTKDKQYLYLDEMLTRNLIKLDNIDTQGQEIIRSARKEAIKCIEKTIGILEAKAAGSSNVPTENSDIPDESSDIAKESSDFQAENSDVPKEGAEAPKEMEVDEKIAENNNTGASTNEENKIESMETEPSSNQIPAENVQEAIEETSSNQPPAGDQQETMEVSELTIDTSATSTEAEEKKEASSDSTLAVAEKVPEVKVENTGESKVELEMSEASNPAPESNASIDKEVISSGEKDGTKVSEDAQTAINPVKTDQSEEKKDKKKGKKKTEKKEK